MAGAIMLACLCLLAVDGEGTPANATFPGENGFIAYTAPDAGLGPGTDIWVADTGGANPRKLTNFAEFFSGWGPAFSPDASQVAFELVNRAVPGQVFIDIVDVAAAAAGGCLLDDLQNPVCRLRTVVSTAPVAGFGQAPAWSPDAGKLAYAAPEGIYAVNISQALACPDAQCQDAARTLLIANTASTTYEQPNWAPDGERIAIRVRESGVGQYGIRYDIGTVPAAGGQLTHLNVWADEPGSLTDNGCRPANPNWSPNGEMIAYETGDCTRPVTGTLVLPPFGPITYQQIPASGVAVVTPGSGWHRLTHIAESYSGGFIGQTDPVWAPDGQKVLYYGDCHVGSLYQKGICVLSLDGGGLEAWGALGTLPDWGPGEGSPDATFDARQVSVPGLIGVHTGDTVRYNGEGWNGGGAPIQITWSRTGAGGVSPATAAFAGEFEAPDFPEFDSRLAALGQQPCRVDITARQGGVQRRVQAQGEPGELVHYAQGVYRTDGDLVSYGQSITCKGALLTSADELPLTLGGLSSSICDDPDLASQFTLVTSSISGRPTNTGSPRQVAPYPGLWVQMIGPAGTCIDASGINADQVWIGRTLVARGHALGTAPEFLARIPMDTPYVRRPVGNGVSVNAHIVQFLLPEAPPNDLNQNGIDDDVEEEVQGWNRIFSDARQGGHAHGEILSEGSATLKVLQNAQRQGIDISAEGSPFDVSTGEETAAELDVCGQRVRMTPGDSATFRCDSLGATAQSGGLEVFMGPNTLAAFAEGAVAKISQLSDHEFRIENDPASAGSVLVFAEGALSEVEPGAFASATVRLLKGDIDCDGVIGGSDALGLGRRLANLTASVPEQCRAIGSGSPPFGDITCEGTITHRDLLAILRYLAGLPLGLPAQCLPPGTFLPD